MKTEVGVLVSGGVGGRQKWWRTSIKRPARGETERLQEVWEVERGKGMKPGGPGNRLPISGPCGTVPDLLLCQFLL